MSNFCQAIGLTYNYSGDVFYLENRRDHDARSWWTN